MPDPSALSDCSIVGIRASWTCALCGAIERTYQLMRLADLEPLDVPRGWRVVDGSSVCAGHAAEPSQVAAD